MSVLLTRLLRGLLYGVSAMDPVTVLSVTALLFLIAAVACYVPALKAMKTDPMSSIRAH